MHAGCSLGRSLGPLVALVASTLAAAGCVLAQPPPNLLTNPRLDDGILAPTGWGLNAGAGNQAWWQVSTDGATHAVLLEGSGQDWAGLTSGAVPAQPGEVLTVAAGVQLAGDEPATDADRLFVRFFRAGAFVGQEGPPLAAATAEWRVVSGTVTAPDGVDGADVSVQIRSRTQVRLGPLGLLRGEALADIAVILGPPPQAKEWSTVREPQNLPADADDNGLPDALEAALGITPADRAVSTRRTRERTTSFQTPTGYRDDNDLKVDAVIVAGNDELNLRSWAVLGYEPQCMVGFRAGPDYVEGQNHRDEVQTDGAGNLLDCGPGSYYMVPTENRRRTFRQYFADAVARGTKAACPEEPEFFSRAGYGEAFRREWQAYYGEPWQDQALSVEARYKSDRLKVYLERKLLEACYEGARSVDPKVRRFLLTHSPLNYTAWGIVFGHNDLLATGQVDAVVAQVWTGTARAAVTYAGEARERTFENGYLEYASTVGVVRDRGVDLWFLMDPLEDNPDRSMADYHDNYERTLAAALLFPEVTRFETMPWPTRIFGRVPDDFATEICSVINVLSDMQHQESARWDCGSTGIGTFLSDSAMWQRGAPQASDLNCFYGVALPLLMRGIPIEVPNLDRAAEAGYLDRYRLLFVSYDLQKPLTPDVNRALADWVSRGGCLVVLGGEDAYNAVPLWWQGQGFTSPQDHLLSLCGYNVAQRRVLSGATESAEWRVVARTEYTGRNLENQTTEEVDLTPFLAQGAALVRCEDSLKDDGWGAYVTRVEAEGVRDGGPARVAFTPATPEEQPFIAAENGTGTHPGAARFCDAQTYVIYRFDFDPGSRATLRLTIGNQYVVSAAPADRATLDRRFAATTEPAPLGEQTLTLPLSQSVVTYADSGATSLYEGEAGALLSERRHGEGWVLHFGAPASWFARSPEAAEQMQALTRYALERKLGAQYREQGYVKLERGRYVIAKTLDAPLDLTGRFINVLDARLPLVSEVHLDPDRAAILYDAAPDMTGDPRLLFCSSCVEWKREDPDRLRLIVSGAKGTFGTARVFTGGKRIASLKAATVEGRAVEVEREVEGETVLLRYPNEPYGVAIEVSWAP